MFAGKEQRKRESKDAKNSYLEKANSREGEGLRWRNLSSLKSKGGIKKEGWIQIERDGQGRDVSKVNSKLNSLDLLYKFGA